MSVSRRNLLRNSILAAMAFTASPFRAWGAKNNSGKNSNQGKVSNAGWEHLDRAAFNKAVGSGFKVTPVSGNGTSVWLRLLQVEDLPALVPVDPASMAVPPKQTSPPILLSGFMLVFLGTLAKPLPQGTYDFEHPALGKFSMLIVPGGQGSQTYTAVIARLP
jgi:hypothetical protein